VPARHCAINKGCYDACIGPLGFVSIATALLRQVEPMSLGKRCRKGQPHVPMEALAPGPHLEARQAGTALATITCGPPRVLQIGSSETMKARSSASCHFARAPPFARRRLGGSHGNCFMRSPAKLHGQTGRRAHASYHPRESPQLRSGLEGLTLMAATPARDAAFRRRNWRRLEHRDGAPSPRS